MERICRHSDSFDNEGQFDRIRRANRNHEVCASMDRSAKHVKQPNTLERGWIMRDGTRVGRTRYLRTTVRCGMFAAIAGLSMCHQAAFADDDINSPAINDLRRMVEMQQQQIRQMQEQMQHMQPSSAAGPNGPIPATPTDYSMNTAAASVAKPADPYVVGSDLSAKPEFRNGLFLWFATPNNDFTMHIGGCAVLGQVWSDQSLSLKAAPVTRTAGTFWHRGRRRGGRHRRLARRRILPAVSACSSKARSGNNGEGHV